MKLRLHLLISLLLVMGISVSFTANAIVGKPTVQASNIVITNLTATSATISWTNGNGANRAVFIESPSALARLPYDNTTYTASADWNVKGSRLPNSNYYCVYNGSGNTVTLTNLTPETRFAVEVSEYNGAAGSEQYCEIYNIANGNPSEFTTLTTTVAPTVQASNIIVTKLTATSATISWTNGNGAKRAVFIETPSALARSPYNNTTYTASADWNVKGSRLPNSNYYCVYNGSGNTVTLTNLTPETRFAVKVSEYNGAAGSEQYCEIYNIANGNPSEFTTPVAPVTPAAPTVQASNIIVANLTATSAIVSWTNGNGAKRAVFIENPSALARSPYNNTTYTASTDWNVKGSQLPNSNYYCVYNGLGNTVTLTNLTPNSRFTVKVSEYNGVAGSEQYCETYPLQTGNPYVFNTPTATGIQQTSDAIALVTVWPNPTTGLITVTATQDVKGSMTVSISNLSGKQVFKTITQQNSIDIDLTNEPVGIYMVKIETTDSTIVCKVIKK